MYIFARDFFGLSESFLGVEVLRKGRFEVR